MPRQFQPFVRTPASNVRNSLGESGSQERKSMRHSSFTRSNMSTRRDGTIRESGKAAGSSASNRMTTAVPAGFREAVRDSTYLLGMSAADDPGFPCGELIPKLIPGLRQPLLTHKKGFGPASKTGSRFYSEDAVRSPTISYTTSGV